MLLSDLAFPSWTSRADLGLRFVPPGTPCSTDASTSLPVLFSILASISWPSRAALSPQSVMCSKETTAAAAQGRFSLPGYSVGLGGADSEPLDEHTLPSVCCTFAGLMDSVQVSLRNRWTSPNAAWKAANQCTYCCLGCASMPFCCSASVPDQLMAANRDLTDNNP
jgi:hypothetical protein